MKLYDENMENIYDELVDHMHTNHINLNYNIINDAHTMAGYDCIILTIDNTVKNVPKAMLIINDEDGGICIGLYSNTDEYVDFSEENDDDVTYIHGYTLRISDNIISSISDDINNMANAQLNEQTKKELAC